MANPFAHRCAILPPGKLLFVVLLAADHGACTADDPGAPASVADAMMDAEDSATDGDEIDERPELQPDTTVIPPSPRWTTPDGPHVRGDRTATLSESWAAPWPDRDRGSLVLPNPAGTSLVDQLVAIQPALAATTAAVFLPTTGAIDPATLPVDPVGEAVRADGASVSVIVANGPRVGERLRARVGVLDGTGPHAPEHAIVVQPIQGFPWPADTDIEIIVRTSVRTVDGEPLSASGWSPDTERTDAADIAAVARLRTQDPTGGLTQAAADVRSNDRMQPTWVQPPALVETWENFCVWAGEVSFVQFQQGEPPFEVGGDWQLDEVGRLLEGSTVQSRVWFSIPRREAPAAGWPVMQFIRVGGGGDRPLLDRGVRDAAGVAAAGTGLAGTFAAAGWSGLQFDGPHGGGRNPTRGDEQFLMFNITNPVALRDNIRQTALEVAVLSEWLLANAPAMSCDERPPALLDVERQGLFGHSMGATVAPLAAANMPDLDVLVLSGAGGSWVENVLHKLRPLPTRPIAEALLGYRSGTLTEWDPVLNLLQAAGEEADPQAWAHLLAARPDLDILMLQGIADTYILPPIANALSLPLRLTLGGDAIESLEPESAAFAGYLDMNPSATPARASLPITRGTSPLRVLVQHQEDGIEDGHEVAFQRGDARRQIRCLLQSGILVAAEDEELGCER